MLRELLICSAVVVGGCTIITSCPTGQGNNDNKAGSNNAGSNSNNAGNNGNGGSNNQGGSAISDGGEAPTGEWVNITSNLAGIESECGNLTLVAAKPDEDVLIAGVAHRGLFRSEDGGDSWAEIPVAKGSPAFTHRPTALVFDPADPTFVWESGIYGDSTAIGVYRSLDGAKTFSQLSDTRSNELVSIDFTDPARKTLLTGGHEQLQTLFKSVDEGKTWTSIGDKVPDTADISSWPLIIDADTFLLGAGKDYFKKQVGIYRSTDGGDSWDLVSELGGYLAPLVASDGTIYWATLATPGLAKSEDQGKTWTKAVDDNVLLSITPIELPNGRIASATKDAVVVSADGGETWRRVTPRLPFEPAGIVYSAQRKQFVIWHWDCLDVVLDDAIMAYDFDYETN